MVWTKCFNCFERAAWFLRTNFFSCLSGQHGFSMMCTSSLLQQQKDRIGRRRGQDKTFQSSERVVWFLYGMYHYINNNKKTRQIGHVARTKCFSRLRGLYGLSMVCTSTSTTTRQGRQETRPGQDVSAKLSLTTEGNNRIIHPRCFSFFFVLLKYETLLIERLKTLGVLSRTVWLWRFNSATARRSFHGPVSRLICLPVMWVREESTSWLGDLRYVSQHDWLVTINAVLSPERYWRRPSSLHLNVTLSTPLRMIPILICNEDGSGVSHL